MSLLDARNGVSRQTVLALLLGMASDLTGMVAPVDATTLERVLAWTRKQPPGALSLDAAPLGEAPATQPWLRALPHHLAQLDAVLAGWTRNDAWLLGRDDPAYPKRLRRRLGADAPALLFGRGEPALVGRGGVAVVRGTAAADPDAASLLDTALTDSMLGLITLPPGSHEIRVMRAASPATEATLRLLPPETALPHMSKGVADRDALEACCYGLADTVVAVGLDQSDPQWPGLVALIARDQQPVWVLGHGGDAAVLVRAGAHAIPPGLLADGADGLLLPGGAGVRRFAAPDRPPGAAQMMPNPVLVRGFSETPAGFGDDAPPSSSGTAGAPMLRLVQPRARSAVTTGTATAPARFDDGPTLFELFARRLQGLLSHGPLGAGRIAEAMDLTRPQVDAWLLRAEANGAVRSDARTRLFALP